MVNIPVELFLGFIGISVGMAIFGFIRNPQIPAMMVFAGMFILSIAVITTGVIMGKIPESSSVSGSTTTYVMVDNIFIFTELPKTLFGLLGAIFMLSGALMVVKTEV